ncbi:MAG TPA: transcriptional regulator, partial [Bryobacteraceae bacterium]|nr:transcriptional regulator [Bryobacteraceae bacterium]
MELKTLSIYVFGPFRLEPSEHRLLRHGQPISLTPKSFELLLYLVENHGRLVLKDQIMRAVWPGSFVEEANLTVSISSLRKTLGKTDAGLQYIETVPTKGYRFTVPVEEVKNVTIPTAVTKSTEATPAIEASRQEKATNLVQPPSRLAPHQLATSQNARHSRAILLPALLLCALCVTGYFVYQAMRNSASAPTVPRSLAILPL